jgi:diguanylate cyclase (GGDEF)-like protein
LLARYGGEEFAVILPDTDRNGALTIAEHIRQVVEQCHIPHSGSPHCIVTLSIGCSTQTPEQASTPSGLLRVADGALYQAKALGRNRVEVGPALTMESGIA